MDFHFAIDVVTDLAAILLECSVSGSVNLQDLDVYKRQAMGQPTIAPKKQRPGWTHGCAGSKRYCASGSQKSVTVN